jgi:transposase
VLVDLARRRVLDLLPDRDAATLAAWLRAHPGVEIISRDRGGAYAEGAASGAPDAIQVADRFHLLRNLTDAVRAALERHRHAVHAAVPPLERPAPAPSKRGGPVSRAVPQPRATERAAAATRERRLARYEQVLALHRQGLSHLAIERRTGVSRHTIIRWLAAGHFPERRARAARPTQLTPHAAYLRERWEAGCHNATCLWRELRDHRGFRGGASAVRDWVTAHLRGGERRGAPDATRPRTAHPSPRRAAWLWCTAAEALSAPERAYVDAVCAACPALAQVRRLASGFRAMLATRDVNALAPWLAAAERSELRALAAGLRRDRDAVLAAVCFRWSNGQVEGQVNRLKLVKRSMYGRASFPLLRRRVLAA